MAAKRSNLFLFLALACFLGIIVIFIFDGYIGVYDRLVIDNGQFKQTVEADQWQQQQKFGGVVSAGIDRSGQVDFTYTIENHRFSNYADNLEVTLWFNKVKTATLLTRQLTIPSFGKEVLTWSVNATQILPAGFAQELSYNVNMRIDTGSVDRELLINIYPSPSAVKTVPPGVQVPVVTPVPAPAPAR